MARKTVESVADKLRERGYSAAAYHAKMTAEDRSRVQEAFLRDDVRIVVATIAFGMGIDKPNVRGVLHYNLPKHIEGYYQETGRAGRDGLPSEALLLYGLGDVVGLRKFISEVGSAEQRRIETHKLDSMIACAEAVTCRRQVLLTYFGEPSSGNCGNCDVCLDPPKSYDASEDARRALMCIYEVGQKFGLGHIVDVLRGANTARLRQLGHHEVKSFGSGKDHPYAYWESVIRQLVHRGYIAQDIAQNSCLKLLPLSRGPIRDGAPVLLAAPRLDEEPRTRKRTRERTTNRHSLFESLRQLRKDLADEQGIPPYVVFSDATLKEIAEKKPLTMEEMLAISGVGYAKLDKYGSKFLEAVRQFTLPM